MNMDDENLIEAVREYMKDHNICTIAMADQGTPIAVTMYYVSHDLHLFVSTTPDSHKVSILKANPKISVTIDEDYDDWSEIKGIQLFGRASIASENIHSKLNDSFSKKFPILAEYGGIPRKHIYIEIIPEKISYLDFTKEFGNKQILYVEQNKRILSW